MTVAAPWSLAMQIEALTEAQRGKIYRAAENAEVECSQKGCRRRDCNGLICRASIDAALAGGSDA